jgi:hypothetical protein
MVHDRVLNNMRSIVTGWYKETGVTSGAGMDQIPKRNDSKAAKFRYE